MKRLSLLVVAQLSFMATVAAHLYDCTSSRPEHAGTHNMVLFGKPDDVLYAYHLPLFAGAANPGQHTLMHVYQGLWSVSLDAVATAKYTNLFESKATPTQAIPFFSFSPRGTSFKVPEMICDPAFSRPAKVVFGHIEGNPDFPAPFPIYGKVPNGSDDETSSTLTRTATLVARRFDKSAKSELNYYLIGSAKQLYLVHYLTDDENSYDQILAVESSDAALQSLVLTAKAPLFSVPQSEANALETLREYRNLRSPNNRLRIIPTPGRSIVLESAALPTGSATVKILQQIYFNMNTDLHTL